MNTPSFTATKIIQIFAYLGGKLQTKDDNFYLLSQEDATQTQVLPLHDPSTFPPLTHPVLQLLKYSRFLSRYLGGKFIDLRKIVTKDDKIYLLSQEDVDPNGPQTPIRSRRLEQPLQLAATTDKYREFGDATEEFENDAGSYQ